MSRFDSQNGDEPLQEILGDFQEKEQEINALIAVAHALWPKVQKMVKENEALLISLVSTVLGVVADVTKGVNKQSQSLISSGVGCTKFKFDCLVKAGFTREEAMQLLKEGTIQADRPPNDAMLSQHSR